MSEQSLPPELAEELEEKREGEGEGEAEEDAGEEAFPGESEGFTAEQPKKLS